MPVSHAAVIPVTWVGGDSNWNDASNWSPVVVPDNDPSDTYNVFVDGGAGGDSTVLVDGSFSIDTLNISTGDTVDLANVRRLDLALTSGTALTNNGTFNMNGTGSLTQLTFVGTTEITGNGFINLSNNGANRLTTTGTLTNGSGHTIQGAGSLLQNTGGMINNGTIIANGSVPLVIDPNGNGFVNNNALRATGAGGLRLSSATYTNTGATITAETGSKVQIDGGTIIQGGTLATSGTGKIEINGDNPVLDAVTLDGTLDINNARDLDIANGITNNGIINLNSTGTATTLEFINSADATIDGNGVINLSNNAANTIFIPNATLTVGAGQTIRGSGSLLNNTGGLINNGTITADQSVALTVNPGNSFTFDNNGTLQATGSGGLRLLAGTYENDGHSITIGDGSRVDLNTGVEISGGTINASGTGFINLQSDNPILTDVTLNAPVTLNNARDLQINDSFENNDTISLNSTGTLTSLSFTTSDLADPTINGTGTIELSNNASNQIVATGKTLILGEDQTIIGAGNLLNNLGGMTNTGTITANGTVALTINPNALGFTNEGTLEAVGTGGITFGGGVFTNTGESIDIADTSRLTIGTGVEIVGGTINGTGTGFVSVISDGATLDGVILNSDTTLVNSRDLIIENDLVNNNVIELNSTGTSTSLSFNGGDQTLSGTGEINMSANAANRIFSPGSTLTLAATQTISGAGTLLANGGGMLNLGTIIADETSALTIDPDATRGFTNQGTLRATGNGGLIFAGGTFTNTGRTIDIADGSQLTLSGTTTLIGGTIQNNTTGFTQFSADGATLQNVTLEGTVNIANSRDVDILDSVTNNGTINLLSTGTTTSLRFAGVSPELNGTGSVILSSSTANRITTSGGPIIHGANHTIRGAGSLLLNTGGMINNGTIIADQNGAITIDPNADGFVNNGTMVASGAGGFIFAAGTFTNNATGILTGTTKFDASAATLINGGIIAPGDEIGALEIEGDIDFLSTASFQVDLGGTTAGTQHDVLIMTGTGLIDLDGELAISLIEGFTPDNSDAFTILTSTGNITGTFSNLDGGVVAFDGGFFDVAIGSNAVTLSNYSVPEPAEWALAFGLVGFAMAFIRRRK